MAWVNGDDPWELWYGAHPPTLQEEGRKPNWPSNVSPHAFLSLGWQWTVAAKVAGARERPYRRGRRKNLQKGGTWQWGSAICHWACSCRKPTPPLWGGALTVVRISCWQNHRLEKVEGAEGLASPSKWTCLLPLADSRKVLALQGCCFKPVELCWP